MIAVSEIGQAVLLASDNGYNVLVGATPSDVKTFSSYAKHPAIYNKQFDSTAAGRYQELFGNWLSYQRKLGLKDFSPLSQDLMAIQQIRETGALPLIEAGHLLLVIKKIAHLWASLPGAGYGQHENEMSTLYSAYEQAGGTLA